MQHFFNEQSGAESYIILLRSIIFIEIFIWRLIDSIGWFTVLFLRYLLHSLKQKRDLRKYFQLATSLSYQKFPDENQDKRILKCFFQKNGFLHCSNSSNFRHGSAMFLIHFLAQVDIWTNRTLSWEKTTKGVENLATGYITVSTTVLDF